MTKNNEIVLHSGGAVGADYEWVKNALSVDSCYCAVVHSFYGHNYNLRALDMSRVHLRVHSFSSLTREALPAMESVADALGKRVPTKEYVRNLILRNYYQVFGSEYVLAVAPLSNDKKHVQGGTGWAVELAKINGLPILVFDEPAKWWFSFSYKNGVFAPCRGTPPKGFVRDLGKLNITGIGTRKISSVGVEAIKSIL